MEGQMSIFDMFSSVIENTKTEEENVTVSEGGIAAADITAVETGTQTSIFDLFSTDEQDTQKQEKKPKKNFFHRTIQFAKSLEDKWKNNLAALKMLLGLDDYADEDQQTILSSYEGWGGLSSYFEVEEKKVQLETLVGENTYKGIKSSILTSYYTNEKIINFMYQILSEIGVKGKLNILDPCMGTGNFYRMLPDTLQDSNLYGVELEETSCNIAKQLFQKANIQRSGTGFTGAPILTPDELDRSKGEISWNDLETMLSGFAYDAYYNHSETSRQNYFTVWDFAINQGFSFGSGMGTNHHYGYQVRKIYTTAWLMRDVIWKAPNRDNILSTLIFWSALQETRQPYQYGRDELLDSWHTLLMAKTVSALLFTDERERVRALKGLSRWVSSSLQYTPGTIGGIKVDGTTFHHGGFYPAYTTGVLAMVGQFISLTNKTVYEPTEEARQVLKSAFIAMRNYSNKYEWGVGISGRHPFGGSMKADDVAAFAYLALSGDLSGEGNTFDHHLAADYLRLCEKDTPEARYFKTQGITPASAPQGFFVYNYGAAGIFRRSDWMVTLKGYTTDVWGSEIYRKDNRYGRYQSYGSVQIMGYPSRLASGYDENGWDWNRLPGTTTIHLPFELLDSPLPGTTMAHSKENFSGSSSLEGKNGMFVTKLMERELKNFTPDFVARKSVFCFENRMICLGTGIHNSNNEYPTETTLFQSTFQKGKSTILVNGEEEKEIGFKKQLSGTTEKLLSIRDGYNNHYFVKDGNVQIQITEQESRHEKTRAVTQGTFASAWIEHGKAPQNETYEYLVWIQPTDQELKEHEASQTYEVLQRNDSAHIVHDRLTDITAYAVFETYRSQRDSLLNLIPAETMVMYRRDKANIIMSVCDPNLNIEEKAYTTKNPSRVLEKRLELKGKWKISTPNEKVTLTADGENTILTVHCQHGQPVEFSLQQD